MFIYVVLLHISYEGSHVFPGQARWFLCESDAQAWASKLNSDCHYSIEEDTYHYAARILQGTVTG